MKSILFLTHRRHNENQGFAMAITVGFGLALVMIGLSVTLRAENDANLTTSQVQKANSFAAAEIGLTRIQEQLNQNRALLKKSQNDWTVALDNSTPDGQKMQKMIKICDGEEAWKQKVETLESYANKEWQSNGDNQDFRLENYTYSPTENKGKITIEGRSGEGLYQSETKLQAEIQLINPSLYAPALWLRDQGAGDGTKRNSVTGNFWANNCRFPLNKVPVYEGIAQYTAFDFPDLPDLAPLSSQEHLTINDTTTDLVFPRPGDTPTLTSSDGKVKIYQYVIDSVSLNSKLLEINTNGDGSVKVMFYLLGSIAPGTNIKHSCGTSTCLSSDFLIIGYGGNGQVNLGKAYEMNPQICLKGSEDLRTFVFAPGYKMGLKHQTSTFNLIGAAWVSQWDNNGTCGENSLQARISQGIQWQELPEDLRIEIDPQIGSMTSWGTEGESIVSSK